MKWVDLRHVYYLMSADFMAMLSLLHMLMFTLTGFGVIRVSSDINEIQDNIWSLIISTSLLTICLAGSKRNNENTYGKFHRWFLPLVLFLSLVTMITLSAYHGIITVLALHLVLISFSLTGFPCIVLILINLSGISLGTGFNVVLVRRLYSEIADAEFLNKYREISTNYGYGLATKSSIVLIDMGLLFLQVLGGLIFYSRFWKLGLLMSKWKNDPSHYMNDFPLLIRLENLIFGKYIYENSDTLTSSLNKKLLTNPIHSSTLPDSPVNFNASNNNNTNNNVNNNKDNNNDKYNNYNVEKQSFKHSNKSNIKSEKVNKDYKLIDLKSVNKMIKIKDYNLYVEEELDDKEWLDFLEKNDKVEVKGRRTYTNEKIMINTEIDDLDDYLKKNQDDEDILNFNKSQSYNKESFELESEKFSDLSNLNNLESYENNDSYEILKKKLLSNNTMFTSTNVTSKTLSTNYEHQLSDMTELSQISDELENLKIINNTEKEAVYDTYKIETNPSHYRSYNSLSFLKKRSEDEEKLLNININIENPLLKIIYLIIPSSVKRFMRKIIERSGKLKQKREIIHSLRWAGQDSLPRGDCLQFFAHEPYERLYVKWMHSFNKSFYNATLLEIIMIILYSLAGSILLCYRHYLTLSTSNQDLFINNIKRLVTISLRFILYPIFSLIIIIITLVLLSPDQKLRRLKRTGNDIKNLNTDVKENNERDKEENKDNKKKEKRKKKREKIITVYWIMILLCLIDFVGSLFDVFMSLGLGTPPYAVHNSLVMQFLMTKTSAFLLLRFPTLFIVYLIYFFGLFTSQFFLKHTDTLRYITMQVTSQIVIGIGCYAFLIKPIDVNRRRIFTEVILPYVLYLSKFINP